ncbi:Hint domain-containing protein [Thioclava kandeliae]|uniref:Hint domain-containing protein n=1 Tax=Thioclava kandeliae TaxID=3070818 RepID=A0ABV1SM28_9RHOB
MPDTISWGWYSPQTWPGYTVSNQDNLNSNGNGLSVDPAGYTDIILRDADGDGYIWDHDTDDVHPANFDEYVIGPNLTLHPQELALYTNSTIVAGGVTYSGLNIEVTLFTDGTWGARLMDSSIPAGVHYANVTSINLGTWDGVEYDGITISHVNQAFVCFAEGTEIMTPTGPRPIETLRPGDRLCTYDESEAEIIWIGCRRVAATQSAAPVRFGKGTIGNRKTLFLSRQHRVFMRHPVFSEHLGSDCALIAAHCLANLHPQIEIVPRKEITYWHVMTQHHEVIMAEGAWVETLYPGTQCWAMLGPACRNIIQYALPHLHHFPKDYGPLAFPELSPHLCNQIGISILES